MATVDRRTGDGGAEPEPARSAWSPLRTPLFRAFWLAVLASQIGTWMQNAGAAWLMTTLSHSPALVALMQTATSLPTFLLGLPAGALADIVDRRRLMLACQVWMLAAALALAVITVLGAITPALLLALTFAIGIGVALSGPAWQATAPHLVPRPQLAGAVALNGVAVNLGRAVGPAAGGLLLAAAGTAAVFFANSLSFVGLIVVAGAFWHPVRRQRTLPSERLPGAVRAGTRYLRHTPELRAVLVRTALFVAGASALFALLPVVARHTLSLGSSGFGLLLGMMGIGAIGGAWQLPKLRRHTSPQRLTIACTIAFAAALVALSLAGNVVEASVTLVVAGVAWIGMLTSLNVVAQVGAAPWVRARALAAYLMVFQGGLALGSAGWGVVAEATGPGRTLAIAAAFLAAGLVAVVRYPLAADPDRDLEPSPLADPRAADDLHPEHGPVLVTVEYLVDPNGAEGFLRAVSEMGRIRRRDGAYRWGIYRDVAEPGRYVETFLVESWLEHLRQHRRSTAADMRVRERVHAFHVGTDEPEVTHLVSARVRPPVMPLGVSARRRV
jgi:predicted MFS family arabinose efflux permease